ncbi:hypothetical protein CYY_000838 [Polysphondylium violaceum]|uniref:WD40 repeat-containing protein n=1 Tax=Polysphondylium violaceum TaxID=133409 RepID=A0A8J4QA81_9MYCE|nr:hypothetical protein CYY_000838 [Polysphondylium violaceum]
MRVFHRFSTSHEDLIHDVSYDFYGKRIATCSSDQKIKVWDLNDNGEWGLSAEWKAHSGSVWKLAWAHPEFGQVIASCSFDRTVCIWEESEDEKGQKRWQLKATLVDSRDSVTDIKFAPKSSGLRLATCSSDGYIRIYEAMDIMNLSQWTIVEEFEPQKGSNNCISWNPSSYDKPMMAVGSNDPYLKIWEYNETGQKWVHLDTLSPVGNNNNYDSSESGKAIHDVCWAPNMGRSYHLIATASKDHTVRIWKLTNIHDKSKMELKEIMCKNDHRSEVWRVEWNITGTVLASSGDDGNVFLWKCNMNGEWKLLSIINGEERNEDR